MRVFCPEVNSDYDVMMIYYRNTCYSFRILIVASVSRCIWIDVTGSERMLGGV